MSVSGVLRNGSDGQIGGVSDRGMIGSHTSLLNMYANVKLPPGTLSNLASIERRLDTPATDQSEAGKLNSCKIINE